MTGFEASTAFRRMDGIKLRAGYLGPGVMLLGGETVSGPEPHVIKNLASPLREIDAGNEARRGHDRPIVVSACQQMMARGSLPCRSAEHA